MRFVAENWTYFFVTNFFILLQTFKNELTGLRIIKYNHEISGAFRNKWSFWPIFGQKSVKFFFVLDF